MIKTHYKKKKQNPYQSLAHTDDITKVLDGRPESLLHITTEKHSA